MSGRGGSKGGGGKKGYRTKATQLEAVVRDKLNSLAKLQNEAIFLRQKGAVLEQLLEVASEVAVHKREHTGIKFPNLHDPQLLEFLENFLENYGGFGAERPTAQNYFNLQKLDVDQFKDVRYEDFKQKYTSLVQCLSLLLLQATDDSLKGGLTTTMDELKQLLLGTLLWSPLTFMQVGTQNLQTGDEVLADPSHSDQAITGIQLTPEQEDVLVIIGDLYNTQVATLEATHNNLSQSLDAELLQGTSDTGGVAATIMRISSNMHRLLAIHQLFHIAIMHNLADQQLAHLCVRCFPRFPRMQDLLNALVRIRENRGKGLDLPEPPGHSTGRGLALGINLQGNAKLKPPALEPSVLSKGRLAEAGSKFLQSSSGMLSYGSAGAAVKDEAKSVGGGLGDFEPVGDAAATAEQAVPKSPMADVVKSSGKDGWDAQDHEAGSTTPVKPDISGMLAAPGSSHKRPRSPSPVAAGSNRMGSGSGSKPAKKVSTTGGDMGSTYGAVSSSAQGSRRSKQGAPGKDSRDGIDVNMAVVAAAAAAGMPVDPAAAAALPVPLEHFPAPQQRPSGNGVGQQGGLTSLHIQQLAAHLNAAGGPQDMVQMLESQPKLMLLLQQRPDLMGELQEAMQQQAQQAGMADYAAAQHAAALHTQGMQHQQHGYPAAGRASADGLTQQHWQQAGFQGSGRSSDMPALEMLPPSLVPKDTSSTTPMQTLLHSLSTLLQSCTSVQEAASAAIDIGQAEFVLSAVSAAEAAFATAVKGLADIKARCNRGYSSSAAAAAAGHAAGVMEPALASGMGASLHPAGAGGNTLQPPAGIPVPGPHAAQQALPQSVSPALSGLRSAEVPPTQSTSALLAGMGLSQGLSSVSQVLMQQQVGRGSSRQQGYTAAGASAPGSGPNSTGRGGAAADIQQVSVSMVLQQLSTIKDNPSAIAQLVQILDQQQLLTPEVSSVLAQMMTHASLGQTAAVAPAAAAAASAPADTMSNIAALMQQIQQQQQQQAGLKQVPSSAAMAAAQAGKSAGGFGPWGGAGRHSDGLSAAYDAVAAAAAAGYHMPSSLAMGQTAGASREMLLGAAPTDAAAAVAAGPACKPPASAAAAATGAAAGGAAKGTDKQKEDSPSAGSSTINTGQSGMQQEGQPGPSDPTAAQVTRQAGVDQQQQQQLEGIARAAAAAMTGQLQASGQAEALMSTVMQLLQGQVGADGASSSLGAVAASLLQAMTACGGAGGPAVQLQLPQQQLQPHHGLAAAAGADAATTMGQSSQQPLGQSAAAAATMIPPAAAAAMAAKKTAARAPSARQPASDFADMEVDAVSALEMLAAAAVAEGPQRKRGGNRDR